MKVNRLLVGYKDISYDYLKQCVPHCHIYQTTPNDISDNIIQSAVDINITLSIPDLKSMLPLVGVSTSTISNIMRRIPITDSIVCFNLNYIKCTTNDINNNIIVSPTIDIKLYRLLEQRTGDVYTSALHAGSLKSIPTVTKQQCWMVCGWKFFTTNKSLYKMFSQLFRYGYIKHVD